METAPFPTYKRIKVDYQERIDKIEVFTQAEIKTLYNAINDCYQDLPITECLSKRYELKLILTLYYSNRRRSKRTSHVGTRKA